ncbi:MAG: Trm112 family protein [Paracoccaceae bacterium]
MTDTPEAPGAAPRPAFDRRMLEALICPVSQGSLGYDAEAQELVSKAAGLAFPIRDGIPVMLVDEARRLDRRAG